MKQSPETLSSPRSLENLMIECPNLTKFRRHDHKGLVNTSMEGIDELLHGLGEIDEIRSKIGVFLRTQKLRFVVTRDSGGFSTRLDGFESLQRVTKTSRIKPSTRAHESTKENQNSIKQGTRSMNSNRSQNPGGPMEGRAISVQKSQESIPLILERRDGAERQRE